MKSVQEALTEMDNERSVKDYVKEMLRKFKEREIKEIPDVRTNNNRTAV